jgi:hypothetical protein
MRLLYFLAVLIITLAFGNDAYAAGTMIKDSSTALLTMIKVGIFGVIFSWIFSALGRGQIAKFITICVILSCIVILGDQIVGVIFSLKDALKTL